MTMIRTKDYRTKLIQIWNATVSLVQKGTLFFCDLTAVFFCCVLLRSLSREGC